MLRILVPLFIIFAVTTASTSVLAGEEGGVVQFEVGNEDQGDLAPLFDPFFDPTFGENTSEGHMTWGWRVSYTPFAKNPKWFRPIKSYLVWSSDMAEVRSSSTLLQSAFTPDDQKADLGFAERPHAGFLGYEERLSLADPIEPHSQRIDTATMVIGIVGPLSGAEHVHKAAHNAVGVNSTPWRQLSNEPVLNFSYEIAERYFLLKSHARENLEFMPHARAAVGNAFTYGALGGTLRFGGELTMDNGAPRMGQLFNSNNFAKKGNYWAWNAFLGGEARAVARNILLDGNTFSNSASVDKNTMVYDVQMGFEVGYGATRLTISNMWRSEEFTTQSNPDQFIKAALSYSF